MPPVAVPELVSSLMGCFELGDNASHCLEDLIAQPTRPTTPIPATLLKVHGHRKDPFLGFLLGSGRLLAVAVRGM